MWHIWQYVINKQNFICPFCGKYSGSKTNEGILADKADNIEKEFSKFTKLKADIEDYSLNFIQKFFNTYKVDVDYETFGYHNISRVVPFLSFYFIPLGSYYATLF